MALQSSPSNFVWYGTLKIGIFNLVAAEASACSVCDHQTPWPPIITGLLLSLTKDKMFDKSTGLGQAFNTALSERSKGRSLSPAFFSNEENIISTGSEIWTGPGYPLVAACQALSTNSLILDPSVI